LTELDEPDAKEMKTKETARQRLEHLVKHETKDQPTKPKYNLRSLYGKSCIYAGSNGGRMEGHLRGARGGASHEGHLVSGFCNVLFLQHDCEPNAKERKKKKKKRKRRRWTRAEEDAFKLAVATHGEGNWAKILADDNYNFKGRTSKILERNESIVAC
jgi:hypothetical protein